MSSRNDLRDTLRDDDRRRRDESKINALQTQVDELRSLVRELVSRQGRSEEHFKNYEAGLAELKVTLEQHRHEVSQGSQARQLEDARLREQLANLDERIDETNRPIRALQSHVAELLESIRRGRDDEQQDSRRFDELRTLIDHIAAQAERNVDAVRTVRDSVESLRTEHEQTRRDVMKSDDSIRIVEQDGRRRVAEIHQDIENLGVQIEEMRPTFTQLEAMITSVRDSIVHVDPALEALKEADGGMREEITRIHTQAVERDDIQGERIDELRVQLDASVRELRQTIEQHYERVNERLDGLVDRSRELAYRLNAIDMRLDDLADNDVRLRREFWHLHEMRTRMRLDQIQSELEEVSADRRAIEAELGAERPEPSNNTSRGGGVS